MTRQVFLRFCWVPVAVWAATWLYIRSYDGWGAWAAAPLLLPALLLSGVWAIIGLVFLGPGVVRNRRIDVPVLWATIVGASMLLYYVVRNLL